MSRWGKSRVQNFALPLDALVKEKENTNRPIAARSAGTVGKWGITSFTSIRGPTYGFTSFSPKQDALNSNKSPHTSSSDGQTTPNATSGDAPKPKPKKFFKSRNVIPDHPPIQTSPGQLPTDSHSHQYQQQHSSFQYQQKQQSSGSTASSGVPKISLKINRKHIKNVEESRKLIKPEKIKIKKKPTKESKFKTEEQPTRVLSRVRKVVNYTEDNSRSPSPVFCESPEVPMEIVEPVPVIKMPSDTTTNVTAIGTGIGTETGTETDTTELANVTAKDDVNNSAGPSKVVHDHPPIVLRISKGTSRLISTDSEEVVNSPPYQSPKPAPVPTSGALSSTAELLAVLSGDPVPQSTVVSATTEVTTQPNIKLKDCVVSLEDNVQKVQKPHKSPEPEPIIPEPIIPPEPKLKVKPKPKQKQKPEGIKIKIKTKFTHDYIAASNGNKSNDVSVVSKPKEKEEPPKRITRKSRRNQIINEVKANALTASSKMASPQPGSDNYDLYRTLASSPVTTTAALAAATVTATPDDIDSQSSMLGSASSTNCPVENPEDSRVIHSRGSSGEVTSDQDTSQDSSLVAPPSEMDLRLAAIMECDGDNSQSDKTSPVESQVAPLNSQSKSEISSATAQLQPPPLPPPPPQPVPAVTEGRVTRNKNGLLQKSITAEPTTRPQITKSYSRKRKQPVEQQKPPSIDPKTISNSDLPSCASASGGIDQTLLPEANVNVEENFIGNKALPLPTPSPPPPPPPPPPPSSASGGKSTTDENSSEPQYKFNKKMKRTCYSKDLGDNEPNLNALSNRDNVNNNSDNVLDELEAEVDKPSVKLVISKKKGSIFKSRAIDAEEGNNKKPKRHLYKHKWDDNLKEKSSPTDAAEKLQNDNKQYYNEFDDDGDGDGEPSSQFVRVTRRRSSPDDDSDVTSVKCPTKSKKYYTVVRNVKKAHQIQEIGEFQEMDDDIEYILDALQPHNKMSTRCLSAIQLASKCMAPAFRMHVRAHGTITKFFKCLIDAAKDQSLGLCTATVMFVLNQDNLNMDLDRNSLELMLNLLESDVSHKNALDDCGLTRDQLQRNKQKVKELCSEIKNQGKAVHLNLDNITVGTLAMETLLSLTSKRAGEWFKEELRNLGGLEHIINTICECCRQISDYVVDWTDTLLEKLRKIERCLRVLENVSQENEENQNYILSYQNGHVVDTLIKFYKLCDSEIALYPTSETTPKENPGVVLREALVPTIKVLINLTHPFNTNAHGSSVLGEKTIIFDTSLHLLLQAHNYVPESCIFDISILVLLLLINLAMYTVPNRMYIMKASAPSDFGNQFVKVSAVKALIEYFYKCEELARLVEKKTDDMLDNPNKVDGKTSQEDVVETVTKLLQKAGHHMEHTMLASYVCLLIGHLIMNNEAHEATIRSYLKDGTFTEMVQILDKYYSFMNLTASSAPLTVEHIKQTKMIIEYLQKSDLHSNSSSNSNNCSEKSFISSSAAQSLTQSTKIGGRSCYDST